MTIHSHIFHRMLFIDSTLQLPDLISPWPHRRVSLCSPARWTLIWTCRRPWDFGRQKLPKSGRQYFSSRLGNDGYDLLPELSKTVYLLRKEIVSETWYLAWSKVIKNFGTNIGVVIIHIGEMFFFSFFSLFSIFFAYIFIDLSS